MGVGFPRSTQERAQCCFHATSLRMVGHSEWHCEEHIPHLAPGCALFQPCPYRCYCWESLFTAARWGRNTAYADGSWFLFRKSNNKIIIPQKCIILRSYNIIIIIVVVTYFTEKKWFCISGLILELLLLSKTHIAYTLLHNFCFPVFLVCLNIMSSTK